MTLRASRGVDILEYPLLGLWIAPRSVVYGQYDCLHSRGFQLFESNLRVGIHRWGVDLLDHRAPKSSRAILRRLRTSPGQQLHRSMRLACSGKGKLAIRQPDIPLTSCRARKDRGVVRLSKNRKLRAQLAHDIRCQAAGF